MKKQTTPVFVLQGNMTIEVYIEDKKQRIYVYNYTHADIYRINDMALERL